MSKRNDDEGRASPGFTPARRDGLSTSSAAAAMSSNRGASVLAYCLSSMSMTIVNKYVVSGSNWNMNLLYLAVQVRLSTHLTGGRS